MVGKLFESIQKEGLNGEEVRNLERVAAILDKAQKGQRLARGLSLDGQTEEQIRAQAHADARALIDLFIEVVKEHVADEETRDHIAKALLDASPVEYDEADGVH